MMTSDDNRGKSVLVTGGSGYLAAWMIVGLLREGYSVRSTLRSLAKEPVVRGTLASQVDPNDRLSFVEADLLKDEGWDSAVSGCDYVLHVASPMGQGEPAGTDLVRPAREGTLCVLKAAAKHGVHRVLYTSSTIAAQAPSIPGERQPRTNETTWTDPHQKTLSEYGRSKTLAETAAWDFVKSSSSELTLTTILPGMILGPVMTKSVSGSVEVILRLLTGRVPAIPRIGFSVVDVQDLVALHLKAMVSSEAANQRFIGVSDFLWMSDMASILRETFGSIAAKVPTRRLPDIIVRLAAPFQSEAKFMAPLLRKRREFDATKAGRILGWTPRTSRETVIECAESLIRNRLV